jgi:hypothetical protein
MRVVCLILAGSIAALAGLTAPAPAKNSNSPANANAQKIEDAPVAHGCHAYQQAPDGSWTPLPCQEASPPAPAPTRGKSAAHHPDEDSR